MILSKSNTISKYKDDIDYMIESYTDSIHANEGILDEPCKLSNIDIDKSLDMYSEASLFKIAKNFIKKIVTIIHQVIIKVVASYNYISSKLKEYFYKSMKYFTGKTKYDFKIEKYNYKAFLNLSVFKDMEAYVTSLSKLDYLNSSYEMVVDQVEYLNNKIEKEFKQVNQEGYHVLVSQDEVKDYFEYIKIFSTRFFTNFKRYLGEMDKLLNIQSDIDVASKRRIQFIQGTVAKSSSIVKEFYNSANDIGIELFTQIVHAEKPDFIKDESLDMSLYETKYDTMSIDELKDVMVSESALGTIANTVTKVLKFIRQKLMAILNSIRYFIGYIVSKILGQYGVAEASRRFSWAYVKLLFAFKVYSDQQLEAITVEIAKKSVIDSMHDKAELELKLEKCSDIKKSMHYWKNTAKTDLSQISIIVSKLTEMCLAIIKSPNYSKEQKAYAQQKITEIKSAYMKVLKAENTTLETFKMVVEKNNDEFAKEYDRIPDIDAEYYDNFIYT